MPSNPPNNCPFNLRTFLFDIYGRCDKRCKDLQKDIQIKVDVQGPTDGCSGFCHVIVRVPEPSADQFILELHNFPHNEHVAAWVKCRNGSFQAVANLGASISCSLSSSQSNLVKSLANHIRRVVSKGQQYPIRNWKWIAPRVADSLDELAANLAKYDVRRLARLKAAKSAPTPSAPTPAVPLTPAKSSPGALPAADDLDGFGDLFAILASDDQ